MNIAGERADAALWVGQHGMPVIAHAHDGVQLDTVTLSGQRDAVTEQLRRDAARDEHETAECSAG